MRKIPLLLILLALCAASVAAHADAPRQTGLARVVAENVNLRGEPVDGAILGRLHLGDAAYVYDQRDCEDGHTWYRVAALYHLRNVDGWVRGDLLALPDTLFCDLIDVAAGEKHIIALKADGSVIAGGTMFHGPCDVQGLYGVRDVEAGFFTSAVLFEDGGYWAKGHAIIQGLHEGYGALDFIEIGIGEWAGIRPDGSYLYPEHRDVDGNLILTYDLSGYNDLVQVEYGFNTMLGLTAQGRVHATGYQRDLVEAVETWRDIVQISADSHAVGVRRDGTAVACGPNDEGQCDVENWTDITAVAAGNGYTIGLRGDGTVVATGSNRFGQCDVGEWRDIVQIDASQTYCVGRTARGTLVFAGQIIFQDKNTLGAKIVMSGE